MKTNYTNEDHLNRDNVETAPKTVSTTIPSPIVEPSQGTWHIPRPSLVGRSDKSSENGSNFAWHNHNRPHPNSQSRGSTSSQGSTISTQSTASGTMLLTAANLANFAATHPPVINRSKPMDTASVASSTHFTVVNGLGRSTVYKKSWCARHQLTVLVCTMSFIFIIALLAAILYMEMRARDRYV